MYTTVVCIITSSLARAKDPGNVLWARGEGGLVRASVVNVSQLVTVDKLDLGDRLGRITAGSMKAIREGIHLLVD
jgi:mRNA interferase MazF